VLDVLERKSLPEWLALPTTARPVPWRDLLDGSAYYAACGTDGRPVQYLSGYCHSFVYVDYGYSLPKLSALLSQDGAFSGYQLRSARLVSVDEIDLKAAWESIQLDPGLDGEPGRYSERRVEPYAYWSIFERQPEMPDEHGPEFFSLLYLGIDGVAAFHALYVAHQVVPAVVCIIQPGEGFGGNWTHFFDARQIFCRTILANPAGKPAHLLLGGIGANLEFQNSVVWPGYDHLIRHWKVTAGYFGLWQAIHSDVLNP
jgi:hypothetical protein